MKPLVIFDCDGVLVDSEDIASTVFSEHLVLAGFPYTQQECLTRFTGLSLASCKGLIEQESAALLPENFFLHLQRETFARFSEELEPVPGVVDVLEFLREQRWPCCVASSGSHEKMALTLGRTGLQHYFADRIFSASEVQRGKPAPDLFLHAARVQDYQPACCIVIEDSRHGVEAALAAGMHVCAFGEQHVISADTQVFTRMSELPAVMTSIHMRISQQQEH
ncbi:MAG TPA: HAD family hydrolase [Pseudomonadales bacterium]|nr:HAD family hydrolase [Pseudomonadales bacterium]